MNIIQKRYQYQLLSIEEAIRKSDTEDMILRGNHKKNLNKTALEKEMDKDVEHGWSIPLTIDLIRHIKYAGVVPLGVAGQF